LGVIGIVRITYEFASFSDQFVQQRTLIAGVLLIGLLLGGAIGLILAVSIDRPLRRATTAVNRLASGEGSDSLVESGPTELRQLAGAVNFLVQRLRNLEESRRHLLANLVHELGRPLGALRSAVQALMKGAGQDPQLGNELLSGMDGELARLQSLLTELTQLYDQVLGNLELNRQPLNLAQWLSETITPWEVAAKQKGLEWTTSLAENLPVIQADSVRLGQALGNLFSNAVKFTPAGGQVVVSAGEQDDQVWIKVQDNGPGIPVDEIEKVFAPFYRGGQGRRFVEGMGLGLSIARDLVEAHRGRLELESDPGQGSRFTVWLPKG
jgi:signal transduction histidine kinase